MQQSHVPPILMKRLNRCIPFESLLYSFFFLSVPPLSSSHNGSPLFPLFFLSIPLSSLYSSHSGWTQRAGARCTFSSPQRMKREKTLASSFCTSDAENPFQTKLCFFQNEDEGNPRKATRLGYHFTSPQRASPARCPRRRRHMRKKNC